MLALRSLYFWPLLPAFWFVVSASACGGKSERNAASSCSSCTGGTPAQPDPRAGAGAGGAATTGGASTTVWPDGFGCPGVPSESFPEARTACAGSITSCEALPIFTHFLIERSSLMAAPWGNTTRWQFVREAMLSEALGGNLAVYFFGPNDPSLSACDPTSYASPLVDVEFGQSSNQQLSDAFAFTSPSGGNPLRAALEGALPDLTRRVGANAPQQDLVIVTASAPDQCPSDVTTSDVAGLLTSAREQGLRTVVISLDAEYDIQPLVDASGYLPFAFHAGDSPQRLQLALSQLRDACRGPIERGSCPVLSLPETAPDAVPDPNQVWVIADGFSGGEAIPRVAGPAECDGTPNGGFYVEGSLIHFCPCSCIRAQWITPAVVQGCRLPAKNGAPCTENAQCESKFCYGKAPFAGSLPERTCNTCLEASRYEQWCDEDADCCAGLRCGGGERAGLCVQ
ncbi:MAG TPA: hypothetical protein VG937_38900 [Polyangiaceae bacterium]|nr:hypothetical protein [Polyangiaceae bacterium]